MEHLGKDPEVKGSFDWTEDALNHLADETEGFVGAEIENAVISGLFEAFCDNRAIRMEDFDKAIANTVPLVVTQAEQISAIRAWANVRAVAATAPEDRQDYVKEIKAKVDSGTPKKDDVFQQRGGRTIDI